ncbi:hypothetical protein ACRALDRAFT_1081805 [Sodiomyces alcalophilus JCM 7366]|uniref:uncharacterized protein n=1 Tax=Sodiomyces alcalophilus JCM 7366 TaxID=591952 RepID=UPI0039B45550
MPNIRICTTDSCRDSASFSYYGHRPSLIASSIFIALTGIALFANLAIVAVKRRHGWFAFFITLACISLCYAWGVRVFDYHGQGPWAMWPWMHSTAILSIAPIFLSACLYTTVFLSLDGLAFVLQAAGFALAFRNVHRAITNVNSETRPGSYIVLAAHAIQILSLLAALSLFLLAVARAAARARAHGYATFHRGAGYVSLPRGFTACTAAVVASAALLAGRLGYRVALLVGGIRSVLARDQRLLITLDGGLVILALLALVVLHPAVFLVEPRQLTGAGSARGLFSSSKGKGGFSKLADDTEAVPLEDTKGASGRQDGAFNDVSDVLLERDERRASLQGPSLSPDLPSRSVLHRPPPSFDPQPYEAGRYEPMRHEKPAPVASPNPGPHLYDHPAIREEPAGP